jgi:hypothetical protein
MIIIQIFGTTINCTYHVPMFKLERYVEKH